MFHRNRVIAVRRNTEVSQLYHVPSKENPADLGTRPEKVSIEDVGPGSPWETGLSWMHEDLEKAISDGILKPSSDLRLSRDLEDEYSRGLIFDNQIPDIITRGHAVNQNRVSLLEERAKFSGYLVLPTKFSFRKVVRIYSYVCCFISKSRKNRRMVGSLLREGGLSFSIFFSSLENLVSGDGSGVVQPSSSTLLAYFSCCSQTGAVPQSLFFAAQVDRQLEPTATDRYVNMALLYLFRKASLEVKEFSSASYIKKHMIESDGILLSKSRMVAGLDFVYTGELEINLGSLGIKVHAPVLDRYSPLAFSIAQHIHWDIAPHRGVETQHRVSLEHVHIIQGMSLFKEISDECIQCNMRKKQFIEISMGGVRPEQLVVAPPFWACQIDLFGPYRIFVPGYERETRNRKMLDCQVWVLAVV